MLFLPSPMRRVHVFLHGSDIENAVVELARLEAFHLSGRPNGEDAEETGRWNRLADTYRDLMQRLDDLLDALAVQRPRMIPPRLLNPTGDASEIAGVIEEAEQAIGAWREQKKETDTEKQNLRRLIQEVRLLKPVDMPLEEIRDPDFLHWTVGTLPEENLETLRYALFETPKKRKWPWFGNTRTRKINIFIHESEIEAVTLSLVRLDQLHLEQTREETWSEGSPRWNELADIYSDQVKRLEDLMSTLEIEPPPMPPSEQAVPSRDADEIGRRLSRIEGDVSDWRNRRQAADAEKERLEGLIREMKFMSPLEVAVEEIRNPAYLYWVIGKIPKENLEHLQAVLFQISSVVIPVRAKGAHDLILAAVDRDHADILDRAMGGLFVELIPLRKEMKGTPAECIRRLEENLETVEKRRADLEKERRRLEHQWFQETLTLWRMATSNLEAAEAVSGFARHGDLFLVSGQAPVNAVDSVAAALENAARGRAEIEILEPARRHGDAPVEMMLFRIPMLVIPIATEGDRLLIIAATTRKHSDVLDRALKAAFMKPISLPKEIRGVPAEVLPELEKRFEKAEDRLADLQKSGERLAERWAERLLVLHREVVSNSKIVRAITRFSRHEETFLISGWVPEPELDRVVATMETATRGRADIELLTPAAGGPRRPPTRMRNPGLFRPFEAIVKTFGAPGYDEIDPTPLAALSFTLMYGMMFGDVGHGLMLVLIGWIALAAGKGAIRSLGGVLIAAGLSGTVFGFLYGSLFGREDIIAGLWINPIHDILDLLAVSVIGGAALLTVGYLASMANAFRAREWGTLLFGRGGIAGAVFYWALIGGGYAAVQGLLPIAYLAPMLMIPAAILFLNEPLNRWITGEKPLVEDGLATFGARVFFEIFETVLSHVSNTFSFVRLGAFAMTHAAFMQVIFSLAETGGPFIRWSIILIGTILVVGFEGLVVGIQALRLEYYEFFSKFYGGRGIFFKPFRLYGPEKM
ncbi:MAG: V-type ATP synthase subunit I [Thermodesulfobacteriota bacterium]